MNTLSDINVLIVDDELDTLSALHRFLRKESFTTHLASSAKQALDCLDKVTCNIVVTDLRMPEMNGLELIQELKKDHPNIIRIIFSGTEDIGLIIDSINSGEIFRFIPKPLDPKVFITIINDAIAYCRLLSDRQKMADELEQNNLRLTKTNDALRIISAELRESEMQFRAMNDAAFDPIFLINNAGGIVYINRAGEELFDYKESELLLMLFQDLLSPDNKALDISELTASSVNRLCDKDGCYRTEIECLKKDGTPIPLEITRGTVILNSVQYSVIVARDITLRIEAKKSQLRFEAMQKDLETQIEKKLLQGHIPNVLAGAELSRFMISSGHLNGDFIEFLAYDNHRADILIGDVMGHGILSALVGSGLKSLFLKKVAQSKHTENSLPELTDVVTQLHNDCIFELLDLNTYATLLFARLDLESKTFSMIDCGHTPTIHFHADLKKCSLLKGKNLPMGMIEHQVYEQLSFSVKKDDIIVLYSDGITESLLPDGSLFGTERLRDLIMEYHHMSPDLLVEKIKETIFLTTQKTTFEDDATCIVIRIRGGEEEKRVGSGEWAVLSAEC